MEHRDLKVVLCYRARGRARASLKNNKSFVSLPPPPCRPFSECNCFPYHCQKWELLLSLRFIFVSERAALRCETEEAFKMRFAYAHGFIYIVCVWRVYMEKLKAHTRPRIHAKKRKHFVKEYSKHMWPLFQYYPSDNAKIVLLAI